MYVLVHVLVLLYVAKIVLVQFHCMQNSQSVSILQRLPPNCQLPPSRLGFRLMVLKLEVFWGAHPPPAPSPSLWPFRTMVIAFPPR